MIEAETTNHRNPMFLEPTPGNDRWIECEQGKTYRNPGQPVDKQETIACSVKGCSRPNGFQGLPLCEWCAWDTYALLKNVEDKESERNLANQRFQDWDFNRRNREQAEDQLRLAKWQTQTLPQPGTIYYLLIGDLIKIGYTAYLADRMKAYPPNSVLLATHPGTRVTERQMHSKFFNSLSKGREWFTLTPDLTEHIKEARQNYYSPELPKEVTFL